MKEFLNNRRANAIARQLAPHIWVSEKMLDIGSGGGRVAREVANLTGVQVTLLDTVDYNATDLPLQVYDGNRIPFGDKSFGASALVFVLHHADDPQNLLREAARVSSNRVLVMEDSPGNKLEKRIWERMDHAMNHARHEEVAVAHGTKSPKEWKVDFNEAGLTLLSHHDFRSVFTTGLAYPHTLYNLRPTE